MFLAVFSGTNPWLILSSSFETVSEKHSLTSFARLSDNFLRLDGGAASLNPEFSLLWSIVFVGGGGGGGGVHPVVHTKIKVGIGQFITQTNPS